MIWVMTSNKQATAISLKLPGKVFFKNLICSGNVNAGAYNSKTKLNQSLFRKYGIACTKKSVTHDFLSNRGFSCWCLNDTRKNGPGKTPYLDTFHAVYFLRRSENYGERNKGEPMLLTKTELLKATKTPQNVNNTLGTSGKSVLCKWLLRNLKLH